MEKNVSKILPIIIFLSGFCSLVYQVAWERIIKSSFGGDQISSFIVTSTFILGLGIGAYIFRKSLKKPIKAYAILEFSIAIFALFSYFIFTEVTNLLNSSLLNFTNITNLRLNTIFIAFIMLLPPCILIGGTLPIFLDSFLNKINYSNKKLGFIYGLNTLGACLGIITIPVIFFNHINIPSTLLIVGCINLSISAILFFHSNKIENITYVKSTIEHESLLDSLNVSKNINKAITKYQLLILAFLSGGIALSMEIVFFRLASINWPSSAYNFPLILMIFLFSMGIGSFVFSSITNDSVTKSKKVLNILFLGSALSIVCSVFVQAKFQTDSILFLLIKYFCLVSPFAFFQGGIFPIILKIGAHSKDELTESTGLIYLVNSIGAFFVVMIVQFLLFSLFGIKGVVSFLIFLCVLCIFIISYRTITEDKLKSILLKIFLMIALLISPQFINNDIWNMYRFYQDSNELEGSEGPTGVATISWLNAIDQNEIQGEIRVNGHYMSALPNHPRHVELEIFGLSSITAREILILGLGGGGMVREFEKEKSVENISVVDWSSELIEVLSSKRSQILLDGALQSKKVNIFQADARQFVNFSASKSIDIIIDNLAYTYMSGATPVKSLSYYLQISRILKEEGIFILAINGRDSEHSDAVISGVTKAFNSVYSYGNNIVASNSSLDCFFSPTTEDKSTKLDCPLNKNKFLVSYTKHKHELPISYSKLKFNEVIAKYKNEKEEYKDSQRHINDNFPIYEYYLCSSLINSKCF